MKDSPGQHSARLIIYVFWGAALLFGIQLAFQVLTFFLYAEFKGGLINARFLLWQGLQAWPVLRAMVQSLVVYIAVLGVLSAISLLAAQFLTRVLPVREATAKRMLLNILLLYASLLVINVYHYPNSLAKLAMVTDWQAAGHRLPYYAAVTICVALLAASLLELLRGMVQWWRAHSSRARRIAIVALAAFFAALGVVQMRPGFAVPQPTGQKPQTGSPNIILIGLDSVRADVIEDDGLRESYLPNLSGFLAQGNTAWFTNAYTPIARTFAAWYGLLSGQEPKTSGVRYNLQALSPTQKSATVVGRFRDRGYHTVYGADEKRFSTIDESFGFHETFGPPPGAAEWILSLLEDTPVHNILRDTTWAAFLFPYTYGNRASMGIYRPEHFVRLLDNRLASYRTRQPLFLSIHLCLSHWPYVWSGEGVAGGMSAVEDYFNTLGPLDRQFGDIMAALDEARLLEHSIVVVFTDHGEGLRLDGKQQSGPAWQGLRTRLPKAFDRSVGHGTDLLTLTQNQIMISIQDNTGESGIPAGKSGRLTSLLDITPTLVRLARLGPFETDGMDLAVADDELTGNRIVFMETGFNPAPVDDTEQLVRQGAAAYEITSDGKLQISRGYHDQVINGKWRGATDGRFIMSTGATGVGQNREGYRLSALEIAHPDRIMQSADFEKDARLSILRERLLRYYADEL